MFLYVLIWIEVFVRRFVELKFMLNSKVNFDVL